MPKKKSQQQFIQECINANPNLDYSKTIYNGSNNKIIISCPKHGEVSVIANDFLRSKKCPKCGNNVPTNQEFIDRCKKYYPTYDYSKCVYTTRDAPVTVICKKHNYEFYPLAQNLERGQAMCPMCKKEVYKETFTMSQNDYIKRCKEIHNNKYDYSKTVYTKMDDKVIITCPKHGEFKQLASNHIRGYGCPKCKRSKGEEQIAIILENLNIKYLEQYPIKQGNKTFKIDFYLPDYNIFIEYNGIQHYIPIEHFGGIVRLNQQTERDNNLQNYCNLNQIELIEIKYDQDIKEILTKRFNEVK